MPLEDHEQIKQEFLQAVSRHELTIEQDTGVFRSLLFRAPDSGICSFRINTWPGHLAFTGDMGDLIFERLHDMFAFFRGDRINPYYWSEKIQAGEYRKFDPLAWPGLIDELIALEKSDQFGDEDEYELQELNCRLDELEELKGSQPDCMYHACCLLDDAGIDEPGSYYFTLKPYTYHYLWALYAIQHVIRLYDERKAHIETTSHMEVRS